MAGNSINLFEKQDNQNDEVELVGEIDAVFFESPDSLFKVLLIKVDENDFNWNEDQIVVTGNIAEINTGQKYRFVGQLVSHPKYGMQIQAKKVSSYLPNTQDGLISYLSGAQFKGVGEKTAEKIVEALGVSALDEIRKNGSILRKIGVSKKQSEAIISVLDESNGLENVLIQLTELGITGLTASSIINKYHEEAFNKIQENPYVLVEDIDGIGFKKADQIAMQLGIGLDFDKRIQAGIIETINQWCNSTGDTYQAADEVLKEAVNLLGNSINVDQIADEILNLGKMGKVVDEDGRLYLKRLYQAEESIGYQIRRLVKSKVTQSEKDVLNAIKKVEGNLSIKYDDVQKDALKKALLNPMTVITGGPGTGKTTIVNGLIQAYAKLYDVDMSEDEVKKERFPIKLAAPTGRAAKRMAEVTNIPAQTIHRLLGLNGNNEMEPEELKTIEGGLLVIDEMSMVDTYLFKLLINAVDLNVQIVLVGDKDQLPSVGPGQVFNDLIDSKKVTTVVLKKIYRQGAESSIIELAHSIKNGELPEDLMVNKPDKSFFAGNVNQIADAIDQIASRAVEKGLSRTDLQVLAPMYRGSAGVDELNRHLQKVLNPPQVDNPKFLSSSNQDFRIGDKVLQLVNSPENNVFNGDIGFITSIQMENKGPVKAHLIVDFDGNEITYQKSELGQLTLAYCISIHKSQGSEFPVVIMPLVSQYYRMLKRNLIYTAITRASKSIILLGEKKAFDIAVKNESTHRKTGLVIKINPDLQPKNDIEESNSDSDLEQTKDSETVDVDNGILTNEMVLEHAVDPMIGMDNITPQDFM